MRSKKQRLITVIFLILSVLTIILLLILFIYPHLPIIGIRGGGISVDFSKILGTINLDYGLNEEANWMEFVNRKEIHQFHKDIGSSFIRVWIDDPSFRSNSSIPYENGFYDFNKLDSFIDAVLDSNAVPFVVFAHSPRELSHSYGEHKTANAPRNNYEFAAYVVTIVEHYKNLCDTTKKCNIDEWYWEIWNEPYWDFWWEKDEYIHMYNIVCTAIKEVAPNTNVGGYSLKFLTNEDKERTKRFLKGVNSLDFISLHIYSNYHIPGPKDEAYIANLENSLMRDQYEQEMIGYSKYLFFNQFTSLQNFIKQYYKHGNIEVIVSELGPNWNWVYEPYLDEPFVSAWYASALNWMIRNGLVSKEFYYSGTSDMEDGGFAMWSINSASNSINLFPVYHMKKRFVKYNIKGSRIYEAESEDHVTEVLAVSNENGNYITIINKKNQFLENIGINIKNLRYNRLIDLDNNKTTYKLNLEPYEVKFIKII